MSLIMTKQQIITELSGSALETGKLFNITTAIFKSKILND
jgi:hypothetical protein